jgi:hypothetical protein
VEDLSRFGLTVTGGAAFLSPCSYNYKYPFVYPYERLVRENQTRSKAEPEFEVIDCDPSAWAAGEYWDITVSYAKGASEDILCRVVAMNCSDHAEILHILPHLTFRNTWSWGYNAERPWVRPTFADTSSGNGAGDAQGSSHGVTNTVHAEAFERHIGEMRYAVTVPEVEGSRTVRPVELLVTDNDTNSERIWGTPNATGNHTKDAFHTHVCGDNASAREGARARVKSAGGAGTKAAAWTAHRVDAGRSCEVWVRFQCRSAAATAEPATRSGVTQAGAKLSAAAREPALTLTTASPLIESSMRLALPAIAFGDFLAVFAARKAEADEFYDAIQPPGLSPEDRSIQRQAFAGLLWNKQFYHFGVQMWLEGDPAGPPPPPERLRGRNNHWHHYYASDVISMPDKWEYPWPAVWDLAFHAVPLALIDPEWAKRQVRRGSQDFMRETRDCAPEYHPSPLNLDCFFCLFVCGS